MPPVCLPRSSSPFSSPMAGSRRLASLLALLTVTACSEDTPEPQPPPPSPGPRFEATIRRTSHGIPHITGKDLGSVAYGQGYAFAQDHACLLADQIIKVRGERARYLGPGPGSAHVASDLGYLSLDLSTRASQALPRLTSGVREMIQGYAAGYNRYLEETGPGGLPAACANAEWVKPITDVDLMAYHISVGLLTSSYQFISAIAAAQPPAPPGITARPPVSFEAPTLEQLQAQRERDTGSNGWAIGAERSQGGRGMLVANPHFPWQGELRFWENQLTVPGVMNVYGVALLGAPGVLIGFNEHVAWTHTVSAGQRMTLYRLKLVPGKPTHYLYDGKEWPLTARTHTVSVRQPDGSLVPVNRTLYSSHFGPLIVIPGAAEWSPQFAYTYCDANLNNTQMISQFHGMDRAKNLKEFQEVFATSQGIPWVNTMAADRDGNTWYVDSAAAPNLSPAALQSWLKASAGADPLATQLLRSLNLVLLDGSTSANAWVEAPGARTPGLVPFSQAPKLARRDFVFNANDSYWLANPAAPLAEVSPMHGFARRPPSPRTRMNMQMLTEVSPEGASGADGKFTLDELQAAILNNRSITAELLRAQVVERCQRTPSATYEGKTVDLTKACATLGAWNGRFDADSTGAVLWREFTGAYPVPQLSDKGALFQEGFHPDAPLSTPHTLAPAPSTGEDPVRVNLAKAVTVLQGANLALDVPLATAQFAPRGDTRIGLHGGLGRDGVANVVSYDSLSSTAIDLPPARGPVLVPATGLTSQGYVVANGTSFLMALEFTEQGPNARALLTYSESSDPASPYYRDQTELFARKQWRAIRFTEEDILADPDLTQLSLTAD
jgi:acyl-homoserine-lactone acylase